jgi:hypothetical protein
MTKEYEINDILNAVNSIYKTEGVNKKKIEIKNNFSNKKDDILTSKNQVKSTKSEILVLDDMIE